MQFWNVHIIKKIESLPLFEQPLETDQKVSADFDDGVKKAETTFDVNCSDDV